VWHQRVDTNDSLEGYDEVINDFTSFGRSVSSPVDRYGEGELARELLGDFAWWTLTSCGPIQGKLFSARVSYPR